MYLITIKHKHSQYLAMSCTSTLERLTSELDLTKVDYSVTDCHQRPGCSEGIVRTLNFVKYDNKLFYIVN